MSEDVLYRFRSSHNLLDGYNELENQEIYFAPPEQLNDPMEGFNDIYWSGDNVVWENLLKHYMLCLEHCCSLLVIAGEDHPISKNDIPVFKTKNDLPTEKYTAIYQQVCDSFFADKLICNLAVDLSKRKSPIRRNELIFHLSRIHHIAIETIFSIYEENKLIPKRSNSSSNKEAPPDVPPGLEHLNFIDLLNQAEEEHPEIQLLADTICSAQSHVHSQINLIACHNDDSAPNKHNRLFVFSEFPEAYVQELEKIVHPEWYTACFMSECNNSSVWGHYGDNHRGVCLMFKVTQENDFNNISLQGIRGWGSTGPIYGEVKHRFHAIDYEKKFVEIDFFKSLGRLPRPVLNEFWYTNGQGLKSICAEEMNLDEDLWRNRYWKSFFHGVTTKHKDWNYEKECRLIFSNTLFDISDQARRKLKYNFCDLKGIIFGIKTSQEDKLRILKIVESKCTKENRKDFKFYQAHYSHHKGTIDYAEMNLLKFEE